jgi:hypothetical protein
MFDFENWHDVTMNLAKCLTIIIIKFITSLCAYSAFQNYTESH